MAGSPQAARRTPHPAATEDGYLGPLVMPRPRPGWSSRPPLVSDAVAVAVGAAGAVLAAGAEGSPPPVPGADAEGADVTSGVLVRAAPPSRGAPDAVAPPAVSSALGAGSTSVGPVRSLPPRESPSEDDPDKEKPA
ncbi:hypothetical protein ACWDRX_38425, partial [Streptomyces nigra]